MATGVLVLKAAALFWVGKYFSVFLVGKWPDYQLLIQRIVVILLFVPLIFWVLKPFFDAVGLGRRPNE